MDDEQRSWGVLATGVCGSTTVQLLQPMEDGPWLLQLSRARWELFFEIEGEETALELCAFAHEHANREVFAEHQIGTFHSAEVLLVKDSEFADRFWLRIRGAGQMAEVALCDEEASAFVAALTDLAAELEG